MTWRSCVGLFDDVEAGDRRASRVRLEQRGEDPDRRRLAGAVRPEQTEDGALGDLEVDAVERADLALAGLVDLDQAFGGDGVRGHGVAPGGADRRRGPASIPAPARLQGWPGLRSSPRRCPGSEPGSTAGATSSRCCSPSSSCGSGSGRCCRSCRSTSPSRAWTWRCSASSSPPGRPRGWWASRSSATWRIGRRACR